MKYKTNFNMNFYVKHYLCILWCFYITGCIISVIFVEGTLISNQDFVQNKLYCSNMANRFFMLLSNNGIVALRYTLFGVFSFGILPLFYSLYNGYVMGIVFIKGSMFLSLPDMICCTLPHAILEEIGLFLAGYIGFLLSYHIVLSKWVVHVKGIVKLCFISFILIIISAFIESYVSMSIS